ncbi:MAG: primosomal protein N' [Flavobacteriales bacterium]|nr:primosomal protein N' [Flavobacteriales bacterium]MCX7650883.1 primosomal protein N' [Flavobacteriales bacterium]MDW8432267.1 primosomal protein N' [Flavobacteriales bacterium]
MALTPAHPSSYSSYAEVLLPLPLAGPLTYGCPPGLENLAQPGCRAVVSFRKNRPMVGLIIQVHANKPVDYAVKPLLEVLDSRPVIHTWQWTFWQEMAQYYLCTPGEVLQAAIPAGLLPQSRTLFRPHPEAPDNILDLEETEYEIFEFLQAHGRASQETLLKHFPGRQIQKALRNLVSNGWIVPDQEWERQWRPKKIRHIVLSPDFENEEGLRRAFDLVRRAPRQEAALLVFLKNAGWDAGRSVPVPWEQVMKEDPSLQPAFSALIKKKILALTESPGYYILPTQGASLPPPQLTEEQNRTLEEVLGHFRKNRPVLLFGETSSGKTEIYLHLILDILKQDPQAQALLLVPEIALTTQLIERLRSYLGDAVAVFHSRFGENNRTEVWMNVLNNQRFRLVVGARSALLLPFANLRLIVVDEEHDASYRQEDPAPRYQARDFAVVLARRLGIPIVLGSATPSVESYFNALNEKYALVRLNVRYGQSPPPRRAVVNLAAERRGGGGPSILSKTLLAEMEQCLHTGRQIILFQNRKGYAPVVQCPYCGYVPACRHCDISLTLFQHPTPSLRCRYCSYAEPVIARCPVCHGSEILKIGFGTEKVEAEVARLFPGVPSERLDAENARTLTAYRRILERFDRGETRILIGTQMVTKGLDFARVGLVGILNADTMLSFPDFRAGERTYQTLVQAAGRAGRRQETGLVLVQTYRPDHPVLTHFLQGQTQRFLEQELQERRQFGYPPFVRLLRLTFAASVESRALQAADHVKHAFQQTFQFPILGPEAPPVGRIRDTYLYDLNVKSPPRQDILKKIKSFLWQSVHETSFIKLFPKVRVVFRVDP